MSYILLIIISLPNHTETRTIEFRSQSLCDQAREAVISQMKIEPTKAICLKAQ